MANTFRLKRSSVSGKVPTTGDLQLGELAVNTFDGKLYTLRNNGTASVVEIGGGGVTSFSAGTTGLTPSTATTGAVTLGGTLAVANGGTGVTTSTGSGSNVLSTSPTLVTPILGTPTSGTLTNCTGYTFANLASRPTTLAGYGITDAASSTHTHGNITNAGAIGTTSGLPIITTTGGVLTTGSFGTTAGTFCQGNDSRLSDARTPLAHTHGNITNAGAIGTTSGLPIITTTSGVLTTGTFGTTAGTFCQGNDSRLSDTRNTTNSVTFNNGGAGGASGSTFNGSGALTVSYNTVGAPSTTGTNASGTWGISITGSAAQLNGISSTGLFNNMGQGHSTRTGFDATTPSYDFGFRFVQGTTNGPGTGGSQFYSLYMGLGSEYPATGAGSYGMFLAIDRNVANPYLSVRYNESNSLSTWRRISAGYADAAPWSGISGKPTTLSGYGITDAAPLASPSLTGTPTAPTAALGTNTTQIATTAYVNAEIANDAPTKTGGGASGTWGINITGSAGSATTATTATNLSGGTVSATTGSFSGDVTQTGTGALRVANGTTAQRPTGATGHIRYNTTLGCLEAFVQGVWQVIANMELDYGLITNTTTTTFDYGALA